MRKTLSSELKQDLEWLRNAVDTLECCLEGDLSLSIADTLARVHQIARLIEREAVIRTGVEQGKVRDAIAKAGCLPPEEHATNGEAEATAKSLQSLLGGDSK